MLLTFIKYIKYCESVMAEKINWSPAAVTFLIEQYEANEFLYNPKLDTYRNRELRISKYKELAQLLSDYIPECTYRDIKKKINGLRSQYLAEKMKINKSIKSGCIYKPTLYWFPLLSFLDDVTTADKSHSNISDDVHNELGLEPEPSSQRRPTYVPSVPATKKMRYSAPVANSSESVLLLEATKTIREMSSLIMKNKQEDSFEIFGNYVASELREIGSTGNQSMLIIAKKKIQQAIIDAWEYVDTVDDGDLQQSQ